MTLRNYPLSEPFQLKCQSRYQQPEQFSVNQKNQIDLDLWQKTKYQTKNEANSYAKNRYGQRSNQQKRQCTEKSSLDMIPQQKSSNHSNNMQMKFSFNQEWQTLPNFNRSPQNEENSEDNLPPAFQKQREVSCKSYHYMQGIPSSRPDESNKNQRKELKEIQNVNHKRSNQSVGCIRRNKNKNVIENKILHQEFFKSDFDLEEIENIRMSKLTEMNQKLNRVLNKENIKVPPRKGSAVFGDCKQEKDYPRQAETIHLRKQVQPQPPFAQTLPKPLKDFEKLSQLKIQEPNPVPYLEKLFQILDEKHTGSLSRQNCKSSPLPDELKYVFGSIFTKIFLKKLRCNKRQFVKLCLNALKDVDFEQIIEALKSVELSQREKVYQLAIKQTQKSVEFPETVKAKKEDTLFNTDTRKNSPCKQSQQRKVSHFKQSQTHQRQRDYSSTSKAGHNSSWLNNLSQCSSQIQRRKSAQISQSVLFEHCKSLRQLSNLDQMVSQTLNTQHLKEQNGRASANDTLHFDELLKHI